MTNGRIMRMSRREKVRVLFELYAEKVRAAAYFVVYDNDVAEDVVQITFVTAMEKLDQLQDPDKIEAWLTALPSIKPRTPCGTKQERRTSSKTYPSVTMLRTFSAVMRTSP